MERRPPNSQSFLRLVDCDVSDVGQSALRPVVLGGLPSPGAEGPPELALAAIDDDGAIAGWVVVDRQAGGATVGGLSVSSRLTLPDACLLARSTTAQCAAYELDTGSHHCVALVAAGATTVERAARKAWLLDVISQLADLELECLSEHGEYGEPVGPTSALDLHVDAAVAVICTVLGRLGVELAEAVCGLDEGAFSAAVGVRLDQLGVTCHASTPRTLRRAVDVRVVGGSPWTLDDTDARAVRAGAVVALTPGRVSLRAEEALHARETIFLPEALAAGAALATLVGAPGDTGAAARLRTHWLLDLAEARGETPATALRGLGTGTGRGAPTATPLGGG